MTQATTTKKDKPGKNGSVPNDPDRVDGIVYNDDGTIDVIFPFVTIKLRTPNFGEFKVIKRMAYESGKRIEALSEAKGLTMAQLASGGVASDKMLQLEEIIDKSMSDTLDIVRYAIESLGDNPLPEDEDDLPVWFVANEGMLGVWMTHWRRVPLGHG